MRPDEARVLPVRRIRHAASRKGVRHGALAVWDGSRPRTPRVFTTRHTVTSRGVSLTYASEQITTPTDWHFRESDHVLVVHLDGHLHSMEVVLEAGPRGRANPQPGDIWVIPAGRSYDALAQGTTVRYCQLSLPPALVGDIDLEPAIHQRDPLTHQIVRQIGALDGRDDVFSRLLTDSLLQTWLRHLSETSVDNVPYPPWRNSRFDKRTRARLLEYLDDNLDSKIGLKQLAAYTAMTVTDFTAAFGAAFDSTPHQFLLDRRMNKGARLLETSSLSVTAISAQLGFGNSSQFSAAFKRRFGMTPSTYRQYIQSS